MELFKEEKDCFGCSACMNICQSKAITMKADKRGFLYPQVDTERCVGCNLCKNICPLRNYIERSITFEPLVFAAKNRDVNIRNNSSSGGVFYGLAEKILEYDGIVYGALFDDTFQVIHKRGKTIDDIYRMQGSKYVQSNLGSIFKSVEEDLLNQKKVLFIGCPCQIDGLKRYLKDGIQDNLVTCDLVCKGVNSPKIWRDYLTYITKGERILAISFRDKTLGWRRPSMNIQTNKRNYIESASYDYFFQAFYSSLILRKSCFFCQYSRLKREGDITIGDFWGIENIYPQMDDNRGISLVIVNSIKGQALFSQIESDFDIKKVNIKNCIQPSLESSEKYPKRYEEFWNDYFDKGFLYNCKKYFDGGLKGKIKKITKKGIIKIGILKK